jgi:hypothetical protein
MMVYKMHPKTEYDNSNIQQWMGTKGSVTGETTGLVHEHSKISQFISSVHTKK